MPQSPKPQPGLRSRAPTSSSGHVPGGGQDRMRGGDGRLVLAA